jgi:hypothetical protein
MTWEWSHTQARYDYVRDSISNLAIDKLKVIWAEIMTYKECLENHNAELRAEGEEEILHPINKGSYFDNDIYDKHLNSNVLSDKSSDDIAEEIWRFAAWQSECDNGGFNAYICPYKCHTLPFARVEPKKRHQRVQINFLGGGTDVEEDEVKDLDDPTFLVVEGSGKRIKMRFVYSFGEHEYLVYSWDEEEETLVWQGEDLGEAVEAYNKI